MHREIRLKLGLAFGSVLIAFFGVAFLGEVFLRWQGPGLDGVGVRYLYRWHPSAGYALSAGVEHDGETPFDPEQVHGFRTHTNAYGFRSQVMAFEKQGFRILMLGDSFTFGTGVADEETFSWMLNDLLKASPAYEDAEVLNAGTNGSSNVSQVNYFWSDGVRFRPDLVVLNIYTGNDFDQNLEDAEGVVTCFRYGLYQAYTQSWDWIVRAGYRVPGNGRQFVWLKPSRGQCVDEYLHGRSRFYREISDRALSLRAVQWVLRFLGQIRIEGQNQRLINVHQTGNLSAGRRYTEEMLWVLREDLEEVGVPLLVHLIPYRKELRVQGTGSEDPEHRRNTERFLRFLDRYDFVYVSDIPAFEGINLKPGTFYGALWGHYTLTQHRLVSRRLYRAIANGFLEIDPVIQDRVVAKWVEGARE